MQEQDAGALKPTNGKEMNATGITPTLGSLVKEDCMRLDFLLFT